MWKYSISVNSNLKWRCYYFLPSIKINRSRHCAALGGGHVRRAPRQRHKSCVSHNITSHQTHRITSHHITKVASVISSAAASLGQSSASDVPAYTIDGATMEQLSSTTSIAIAVFNPTSWQLNKFIQVPCILVCLLNSAWLLSISNFSISHQF